MTTASTTSVVDQSTDAGFRTWGLEFSTQLGVIGLVQTADTGQINWTTVTRASAGTAAGYEIWRFADSTIFMKIEYGSGGGTTSPQMWITAGTGSNGSGTITAQTSTRATFCNNGVPTSTATTCISRWCRVADAFAVSWKEAYGGSATSNGGLLVVGKTTDGTGAPTTTGFGVLRCAQAVGFVLSFQTVRTAAVAQTFIDTTQCAFIPGTVTSSTTAGGKSQAYDIWLNTPDVIPFQWANLVLLTEASRGTSFSVAQIGTTTHTYASTGQIGTGSLNNYSGGTYGVGYIFE